MFIAIQERLSGADDDSDQSELELRSSVPALSSQSSHIQEVIDLVTEAGMLEAAEELKSLKRFKDLGASGINDERTFFDWRTEDPRDQQISCFEPDAILSGSSFQTPGVTEMSVRADDPRSPAELKDEQISCFEPEAILSDSSFEDSSHTVESYDVEVKYLGQQSSGKRVNKNQTNRAALTKNQNAAAGTAGAAGAAAATTTFFEDDDEEALDVIGELQGTYSLKRFQY